MGKLSSSRGTAFVHVGTHKTGTTSLQVLLASNDHALQRADVFVPQTGRISTASAGHHNIAWELANDPQFDPQHGTFAGLLREAAAANASTVCLTSEEFEFLNFDEAALKRMRDGLLAIGYKPKIILYLRPQADYLESLYAEASRVWNIEFGEFVDTIVATGLYGRSRFEYDRLAGAFSAIFGKAQTIVRAYRSSQPPDALLQDFIGIIAPNRLDLAQLTVPARLNPMADFSDVITFRERHLGCRVHHTMTDGQRFDPLNLSDILRLAAQFSRSNERLWRAYGAGIGCVSAGTFVRELITALFRDRDSQNRKALIRDLIANEHEVAA